MEAVIIKERKYIAIDLKSFYASVECVEKGLDPLNTNLVVADKSRTEKTICLAVSPSLKSYGISGRARLFEVVAKVREVNAKRRNAAPNRILTEKSIFYDELVACPEKEVDYLVARPRMAYYIEYSQKIYNIYLKYIAPEDMHVYSIDEVFMDVTDYLNTYRMTPHELAMKIIREVLKETGITATAGVGDNLYLCKIAMDIVAKKMPADKDGVRIAELDEMSYRRLLWEHTPITDFWRVGRGYARRLAENGMYTMGDVARCSIGSADNYYNEDLLYRLFGVNAELLIDHAWGYEPCTIDYIKAYKPENNSLSSGQVLHEPYTSDKARLVLHEMTDLLVLELVDKCLVTNQVILTVGYDIDNLTDPVISKIYKGEVETDRYGRKVPKKAHKSANIDRYTSSSREIINAVLSLYDEIVDERLLVRRLTIAVNHLIDEDAAREAEAYEQMDLFTDYEEEERKRKEDGAFYEKEKKTQQMVLKIKKKYGKNAILKGMNLSEGATAIDRNRQIGGHKA